MSVSNAVIKTAEIDQQNIANSQKPMSFLSSIPLWGWFDIGFNLIVLVALGGETDIFLRWVFPEKINDILPHETKHKCWKKRFEWLLIFGIAGEICCLPFSIYGTADAEHEAGQANERAALVESNNLVLKLKLQPRSINEQQVSNFIFLTERIPKIPITIHAAQQGDDTYSFAYQLRNMFDRAGFPRSNAGYEMAGVEIDPATLGWNAFIFRDSKFRGDWPEILLHTYGTNESLPMYQISFEKTNGFARPIVLETDQRMVYQAIGDCLNQIGITFGWAIDTILITNGETEIFVPVKIN